MTLILWLVIMFNILINQTEKVSTDQEPSLTTKVKLSQYFTLLLTACENFKWMILIGHEIVTTDIWTVRQTRGTLIGSHT